MAAETLPLDELHGILAHLGILSAGPPDICWVRSCDMSWSDLARELSTRSVCATVGCDAPADRIESYSDGQLGSEHVPRPLCHAHATSSAPLVDWVDGGWDWLRRSTWPDS